MRLRCNFLFMCSGYYRYDAGYTPHFEGSERFAGRIVHPQNWPDDIDYAGKRVVIIGSGATAVTLVPELAKTAAHVTHAAALAHLDRGAAVGRRAGQPVAPLAAGRGWPTRLTRWKRVLLGMYFFNLCQRKPEQA